jgi:hypothetical protein
MILKFNAKINFKLNFGLFKYLDIKNEIILGWEKNNVLSHNIPQTIFSFALYFFFNFVMLFNYWLFISTFNQILRYSQYEIKKKP